ncbi:hypothetical protein Y032_0108g63 [Ancylostoma ceylanicum]|uniref:F-box domain-containing protein n=1 Tax=Ancylostoma ceylanicum TaxID=53326 RepID=A0A016TFC9_9BILA|nr:hypothetical protein Y032_0108g63 [Ancylostoma ceylanicum]
MEAVAGTVESSAGVEEFQNDAPNSNKTGVKRKISDKEEDSNVSSEECGAMKKVFVTESENKENELHAEICEPVKVPGYFPFFSLPVELRLRILRKVGYWTLRELRQLSHAMYALVGVVLPRKWGRFLVDYSYSPSMYLEGYLRKRWSHLTSSSSCASMLRLAHRAEIPRIMFFKAKLTPYMMKRFVISVKCSQVKVVELNFTYCKITCDVEQFVHFLELCNTQKLVVDDCTMKGDFRNQLQQAAFIQKIDAVITNSWGCSYWSEPQFFTVEKLLGLLTSWVCRVFEDTYLYVKVSLPVKSEQEIESHSYRYHMASSYVHRQGDRFIFRKDTGEEMYVKYKDGMMLINREENPS